MTKEPRAESAFVATAESAANWIVESATDRCGELVWRRSCQDAAPTTDASLYSGTAGIILFFLDLHRATSNRKYLDVAQRAAAGAVANAVRISDGLCWGTFATPKILNSSLYHGGAGIAWALLLLALETGDSTDEANARAAIAGVIDLERDGRWNHSTDVMVGAAGIGLFALAAADLVDDDRLLSLATRAGDDLLALVQRDRRGDWWPPSIGGNAPRRYANFAHGTAGIAFFLARLFNAGGDTAYLDQALRAASWLEAGKRTLDGGVGWCRHEPGGENLFYFGWCHGPSGTARFFHELFIASRDTQWLKIFDACRSTVIGADLLVRQHEGFWNLGMCCGIAGVAHFFLDCADLRCDGQDAALAARFGSRLVESATRYGQGVAWVQAEDRDKPEHRTAQVGRGQGAAGIAGTLLHLACVGDHVEFVRLPDGFCAGGALTRVVR